MLQERLRSIEAALAEQQHADAEMQASTAEQHAREVADLQGQVEALQVRCASAEGQEAQHLQVREPCKLTL